MPADPPPPAQDRWCDIEGNPISVFCWIEQDEEDPDPSALFSRRHQRGQVVGRGPDLVYVRFHGESQVIGVPPRVVRVLDTTPPESC